MTQFSILAPFKPLVGRRKGKNGGQNGGDATPSDASDPVKKIFGATIVHIENSHSQGNRPVNQSQGTTNAANRSKPDAGGERILSMNRCAESIQYNEAIAKEERARFLSRILEDVRNPRSRRCKSEVSGGDALLERLYRAVPPMLQEYATAGSNVRSNSGSNVNSTAGSVVGSTAGSTLGLSVGLNVGMLYRNQSTVSRSVSESTSSYCSSLPAEQIARVKHQSRSAQSTDDEELGGLSFTPNQLLRCLDGLDGIELRRVMDTLDGLPVREPSTGSLESLSQSSGQSRLNCQCHSYPDWLVNRTPQQIKQSKWSCTRRRPSFDELMADRLHEENGSRISMNSVDLVKNPVSPSELLEQSYFRSGYLSTYVDAISNARGLKLFTQTPPGFISYIPGTSLITMPCPDRKAEVVERKSFTIKVHYVLGTSCILWELASVLDSILVISDILKNGLQFSHSFLFVSTIVWLFAQCFCILFIAVSMYAYWTQIKWAHRKRTTAILFPRERLFI